MGWITDKISDIADVVTDGVLMGLVVVAGGTLGLVADAVMALDEIIITIKGIITPEKLEEKKKEYELKKIAIDNVNTCKNVVRFCDMETGNLYKVEGDGISNKIREGIRI